MAKYTVEAGRQIYRDGEAFISINREGKTSPVAADDMTKIICGFLNRNDPGREVDANDLELYAINTGEFYRKHQGLVGSRGVYDWVLHVEHTVIPHYSREIEKVWASADTITTVAQGLREYYERAAAEASNATRS